MATNEICNGQNQAWTLIKKLGEGDAGEVFQVRANPQTADEPAAQSFAILKRPHHGAFAGDSTRQAAQIETEARALSLAGAALGSGEHGVHVPLLLDRSPSSSEHTPEFFIVISTAPGFDLATLARAALLGRVTPADFPLPPAPGDDYFIQQVAAARQTPRRVLLAAVLAVLDLFERMHPPHKRGSPGVLWNDVKPEHIYWDPERSSFTIIDWGNARFLDQEGIAEDRSASIRDDYRQFLEGLGRHLDAALPGLKSEIGWLPGESVLGDDPASALAPMRQRLTALLKEDRAAVRKLRARETTLLKPDSKAPHPFEDLAEMQRQLVAHGELPDMAGALRQARALASLLTSEGRLEDIAPVAHWAAALPQPQPALWRNLQELSRLATSLNAELPPLARRSLGEAVQAVLLDQPAMALWNLSAALQNQREPDGWYQLVDGLRGTPDESAEDRVPPLVFIKRALLGLNAMLRQMEDRAARLPVGNHQDAAPDGVRQNDMDAIRPLARRLREEIIPNWVRPDPAPPFAALEYNEVDGLLPELAALLPDLARELEDALKAPRAQIKTILKSWNLQEFPAASAGLQALLLLDPARRRVHRAAAAIQNAPAWLIRVHSGPTPGASLVDTVTTLELEGRELRNTVGSAVWLDALLDGLKALRRGVYPADVLQGSPDLETEMPWLKRFRRKDAVQPQTTGNPPASNIFRGLTENPFGPGHEMELAESLDTWAPEARGSSARVFLARLPSADPALPRTAVACKIMRMDQVEYARPLFREEARVLNALKDVPGVARLLECGYLRLDPGQRVPTERDANSAAALSGAALRLGLDQVETYLEIMDSRISAGWMPYLSFEKRESADNLMIFCDAGYTGGRFRPLPDLLRMSIQICDILQAAHERNIVYRDHKILHYYWLEEVNGIHIIDWNVARLHPEGLSAVEIHMDLVQFGARALHHILTGRTAPGALPLGPTRPEEIEQAATSYKTQWTYDDRRLSDELKEILERALAGAYSSASALGNDLKSAYLHIPYE